MDAGGATKVEIELNGCNKNNQKFNPNIIDMNELGSLSSSTCTKQNNGKNKNTV